MSKKDKAQQEQLQEELNAVRETFQKKVSAQQQAAVPVGSPTGNLAELLKDIEGVTVSDSKRLRVTAADKETLAKLLATVQSALADYDLTVSPTYGDAAAIGCVWYDIIVSPKLS